MFEWQLNCNLDYDKYEYPYQKIGKKVFENYFDIAFESGLSLDLPRTSKELKDKIDNLLKIFVPLAFFVVLRYAVYSVYSTVLLYANKTPGPAYNEM